MLKGKVKKAIVVLGAGIKQDKGGNWVSTDFVEVDNLASAPGGKARVLATSYVYKDNQENFIIASGGHGSDKNILGIKHPALSKILKRELTELCVPANKIIEESKSNTTYQQLLELQEIQKLEEFKKIVIISNRYHLPRVEAMIKYGPGLDVLRKMLGDLDVKLKSAEDILIKSSPDEWEKKIKAVYRGRGMQERVALEKRGVRQIKEGEYNFR